jgi:hypothetical protein
MATVPTPEPRPGDRMPDGTICAGISPDTGKAMYTTPADAPLTMTFNKAKKYAAKLDAHGHNDWRVPTKAELNVLFNNRAAIGGFNRTTRVEPAAWYYSSSPYPKYKDAIWAIRLSDGYQAVYDTKTKLTVRCVR